MRLLPVLALVAVATGCPTQELPTPEPTPEQPAAPADLVVTLAAPQETVYTRSQVTAEARVSEGQAEKVELLAGEQVIASASTPPYAFTWDTTSLPEGPYTLWARATAHGKSFASNHRIVVVDRTAPVLVGQVPAANTIVEGGSATMTLTFSEPLLASSVQASRFSVGVDSAVSAHLSADGRTVTFQGSQTLARPGALYVFASESGLTDLAGNPVGSVRTAQARLVPAWKAGYPLLNIYSGRTRTSAPVFVAGAGSTAYVAWAEQNEPSTLSDRVVHVNRWNGTSWESLGWALHLDGIRTDTGPSLAVDSTGAPLVAFTGWNSAGSDANAWVYRWDGTKWVNLGGAINALAGSTFVADVALAVNAGAPVIAWSEWNGQGTDLFVRRWNGTSWQALGTQVNATGESLSSGYDTHSLSLHSDAKGTLRLAWSATIATKTAIHVARYTGSAWQRLGSPLSVTLGGAPKQPSLTADASGNPYVAWLEGPGYDYQVHAARWGDTDWEQLGQHVSDAPGMNVSHPSITLRQGRPFVAWSERGEDPNAIHVYVRGFSESPEAAWLPWTKQLSAYPNTTNSTHATDPWLTTDAAGNLVVAFAEEDESGLGGIHFYMPEEIK